MNTTKEEFAVAGFNETGDIVQLSGQFRAGDSKEYFKGLRDNFGPTTR